MSTIMNVHYKTNVDYKTERVVAHDEKSKLFTFRPMVGLETWWDFFLEKYFQPAKNLQNRCGTTCFQKHAK